MGYVRYIISELHYNNSFRKRIIARVVIIVLSKLFIYVYANAESQTVADYENWEFVAYDQEINFYYVDPDSITEDDGLLFFKELTDYSRPKDGGSSRFAWIIADCKHEVIRELLIGLYREKGAVGEELTAYKPTPKWEQVSTPNTVGNLILNYVCDQSKSSVSCSPSEGSSCS